MEALDGQEESVPQPDSGRSSQITQQVRVYASTLCMCRVCNDATRCAWHSLVSALGGRRRSPLCNRCLLQVSAVLHRMVSVVFTSPVTGTGGAAHTPTESSGGDSVAPSLASSPDAIPASGLPFVSLFTLNTSCAHEPGRRALLVFPTVPGPSPAHNVIVSPSPAAGACSVLVCVLILVRASVCEYSYLSLCMLDTVSLISFEMRHQ